MLRHKVFINLQKNILNARVLILRTILKFITDVICVVVTGNISISDLITVPLDMWRAGNEVAVSISLHGLGTQ